MKFEIDLKIPGYKNQVKDNTCDLKFIRNFPHHVNNDLSSKLNRTNVLFFKRRKCFSLIETSRSIYRICYI